MKYFKILFLLGYTLAFGQVGIGTDKPDPNTALDVAGKVKFRDLAKKPAATSNADSLVVTDDNGNLDKASLLKVLQQTIEKAQADRTGQRLAKVEYSPRLLWSSSDWADNIDESFQNLTKQIDVNNCLSDEGEFTAPSAGVYLIRFSIVLISKGGDFNGYYGTLQAKLFLNDYLFASSNPEYIFRGSKGPVFHGRKITNILHKEVNLSQIMFLKKGDKVFPRFMTNDTPFMGDGSLIQINLQDYTIDKIL